MADVTPTPGPDTEQRKFRRDQEKPQRPAPTKTRRRARESPQGRTLERTRHQAALIFLRSRMTRIPDEGILPILSLEGVTSPNVTGHAAREARHGASCPTHFPLLSNSAAAIARSRAARSSLARLQHQPDPGARPGIESGVDEVERDDVAQRRVARVVIGHHRLR